jgi:hypothetical protein
MALIVIVIAGACASQLPAIGEPDVVRAQQMFPLATQESLEGGRNLFTRRCSVCHSLPDPATRNREGWRKVMTVMAVRARLVGERRELVEQYLATFAR